MNETLTLRPSERQWDIKQIDRLAYDETQQEQALLAEGWEPYAVDTYAKHYRRRRTLNEDWAVVIGRTPSTNAKALVRDLFVGWHVIVAASQRWGLLCNRPMLDFHRIVMAWIPGTLEEVNWVRNVLKPRLIQPGQLEWLYEPGNGRRVQIGRSPGGLVKSAEMTLNRRSKRVDAAYQSPP